MNAIQRRKLRRVLGVPPPRYNVQWLRFLFTHDLIAKEPKRG